MKRHLPPVRTALAASLLALSGVALAAAPPTDPAKLRHEKMEQIGDAMKVLGKMAKGQAPFDAATVSSSGTTIKEHLEEASKLFPPGSDAGETHARPEVWSDRPGFEKARKDAQTAAGGLQAVKDEAGFRPALGALGQSCKACHDKYRMSEH